MGVIEETLGRFSICHFSFLISGFDSVIDYERCCPIGDSLAADS